MPWEAYGYHESRYGCRERWVCAMKGKICAIRGEYVFAIEDSYVHKRQLCVLEDRCML